VARRIALVLTVIVACNGCGDDGLILRVAGNQLVRGGGQPVRLLGVNRSGAEYACLHDQGFFAGPTNRQAIAAMARWSINAVRIPLNEACWLGINRAPARYSGARYAAAVEAYVARLHSAGFYVVLDLHWSASGTGLATGQQPMADLDHAPAFWASVARTFRKDSAIAFDLYNEPHGISWPCWRDGCLTATGWRAAGMQTLVDAVRSSGARQPVIATGLGSGNDLSSWLRYRPHDPAHQLAAGFHAYDSLGCITQACWDQHVASVARSVPVIATELGEGGCSHVFVDRFMAWADTTGMSYLGWAWNPFGCAGPGLISSWDGQPTAYGTGLRAHLMKLADADLHLRRTPDGW
jgi:hypothetical protein